MASYEELSGKRIVITGAASGIGLAAVRRFLSEGAQIAAIDIAEDLLEKAAAATEGPVRWIRADVASPDEVNTAFAVIDRWLGGLDVLISNAGLSVRKPFLEIEYEQWSRVLAVNLGGMFLCAQQALQRMSGQGSGVVLFTASTNGLEAHPLYADYNASKAGVILLAKTVALEFAPRIRANAVCPGYVLTPMQTAEYSPEGIEQVNQNIPLKRHADPAEVAALFAFLASEEAAYITGQCLTIDGGETA